MQHLATHSGDNPRTTPFVSRRSDTTHFVHLRCAGAQLNHIEHQLGNCVNSIVRHFHGCSAQGAVPTDRAQLTQLLCADGGLISCLQQAFLFNFKTSRLFKSQYPWDYISRFLFSLLTYSFMQQYYLEIIFY